MGNIGITTFPTDYSIDIAVLAAKAEEAGFDSLWVAEHPVLPVGAETPWPGPGGVIRATPADSHSPWLPEPTESSS